MRRPLDQRRRVPAIVVVAGPLLVHSLAVEEHDGAAATRFLEETRVGQCRKTAERLVLRVGDRGGEGGHVARLQPAVDVRVPRPLEQKLCGVAWLQHVKLERLDLGTPIGDPRGNQQMSRP